MIRIGLISDTHGFLDEQVFKHFEHCDEIWHAGDFGNKELAKQLSAFKSLKGVYGNIDGNDIRTEFPEVLQWQCEQVNVLMVHIGQPYWKALQQLSKKSTPLLQELERSPQLFVCGHSHILKIMFDDSSQCLYMNPGAAGREGWHKTRTIIRFQIDGSDIRNCEVIELGKR